MKPAGAPAWAFLAALFLLVPAGPFVASTPAVAVEPDERLSDGQLENRARDLSRSLRCMVCQNQSIDDSDAPLAKDLRILVRRRLLGGDSDEQVVNYLVSRYGEFVLLRPRLEWRTLALWATPLVLVGAGALYALLSLGQRRAPESRPLSSDEEAALDARLRDGAL